MTNLDRMLQLADEVFASRTDPDQLDVDPAVLEHLRALHPAAVAEQADDEGPVCWVLLIPTTQALMDDFLAGRITERELFARTPLGARYDAVYLCSAMTLAEHRRQGIARRITLHAIQRIRHDHPVKALFVWPITGEGRATAEVIARAAGLPLLVRAGH